MSFDDFEPFLDPDAKALADKMAAFLKSKTGELLEPVRLKGNEPKYYWSIMEKCFCLIQPDAEMYVIPWKITEKGEYYVYSPYLFWAGQVFLVPKEEIIIMGFN